MFCKNCGKEAEANDKFCKACGSKLEQKDTNKNVEKIDIVNDVKNEEIQSNPIVENGNNSNTNNTVNNTKKTEKLKGLRIASLVLGIISLVFFLLNLVLLPLELVGIILAIVYMANNKKFCAGIVLNVIALIISVALFSLGISALSSFANYVESNPGDFETKIEKFLNEFDDNINEEFENQLDKNIKEFEDAKKEFEKAKNEIGIYTEKNTKNNSVNDKYSSGYKYIGSEDYGYIKVPDNWSKFIDVDPNDTIQYSYANVWIATIYAIKNNELTTYKYAKNVYDNLKKDGANSVNLVSQKIANKYYGYKVSCYYQNENIYLTCFIFSDSNNVKHYVAIEGPEKNSEYFDLINTFTLEK